MESANLSYAPSPSPLGPAVLDQLQRTRGWVLFMSVLLWIGAAFLIFGGLAMIGLGVFAGAAGAMGEELAQGIAAMGGMAVIGVVYAVMAFFYVYPALKLGKYAARIRDLSKAPSERALVEALNEQRAFWKYVGVMTLLMIVLYLVFIAVMIVIGVVGAAGAAASA